MPKPPFNITKQFLDLHWPCFAGSPNRPRWSQLWKSDAAIQHPYFPGASFFPRMDYLERDLELPGCYVIFGNGQLLYVGSSTKEGVTLKDRLYRHVIGFRFKVNAYKLYSDRWPNADAIRLIAFPRRYAYLALALERLLVERHRPPRNSAF